MNTKLNLLLNSEIIERTGWTLLHFLWQGALIGMVFCVARWLAARHSALVRHGVAWLALLLCAAAPVTTFVKLAPDSVTQVSSSMVAPMMNEDAVAAQIFASQVGEPVSAREMEPTGPEVVPVVAVEDRPWRAQLEHAVPWCAMLWLLGVMVMSARLGLGLRAVSSLQRESSVVADAGWLRRLSDLAERLGVRVSVSLRASSRVDCPMTIGWWKPLILLPLGILSGLPRAQVEMILAHELAHIRRRDYLLHGAQCVIETLLFFHPIVWWIGRDLRRTREECCDDLAARCGSARELARALVALEEARAPLPALAASGDDSLARVRRLLSAQPARRQLAPRWMAVAGSAALCCVIVAGFIHAAQGEEVIVVKRGQSVQASVDRAPEGAVVRIEAGVFAERVTISKALTLEGAGWDQTILKPDKPEPGVTPESTAAARKRWSEAGTDEERLKAAMEFADKFQRPTLLIDRAKQVRVTGLRIQGVPLAEVTGSNTGEQLVKVRETELVMRDCAIVGPSACGMSVMDGSKAELERVLIAGLWETGLVIDRGRLGQGTPPAVVLRDSDVRNCYHRCITIGAGCDDVRIERCRVSGSAWHGIRYDNASPHIEGNLIFANARCGIYASGETKARVRGNVIFGNEMDAVSCWFANHDEFTGNSFVANVREGVVVIGASKPLFKNNIFALNPVGLMFGKTSGSSAPAQTVGTAVLENNVFWKNPEHVQEGGAAKPLNGSSRESDPQFADASAKNFALLANSPLRKDSIGAAEPIALTSPWPLQAEEKLIIPLDETRDYKQWQKPGEAISMSERYEAEAVKARAACLPWVEAALQIEDTAKREAAIQKIRDALTSSASLTQLTGVAALNRVTVVAFEKAPLRAPLLALLDAPNPHISTGACRALRTCGLLFKSDLPRLQQLAATGDEIVQRNIIPLLIFATEGKQVSPETEAAILRALAPAIMERQHGASTEDLVRQSMRALGEIDLTPSLKQRVIELCADPVRQIHRLAFHYALAPQQHKTAAEIEVLVKFLAHPDTEAVASRAVWAFEMGIQAADRSRAADLLIKLIEARNEPALRLQALRVLAKHADAAHAGFCQAQLAKPGLPAAERKVLEEIVAKSERRQ